MEGVQKLRGLAALAVTVYHCSLNVRLPWPQAFVSASDFGKFGVQAFFVISGFILPYSLWKAEYVLRDAGKFLLKRLARLDPPYLASIVLSIGALLLAARHGGEPFVISWPQIALHLGFLTIFSHYEWLNTVYWTLAVEFQFYLLLAFTFPLLKHRYRWLLFGCLTGLSVITPGIPFLPIHSSHFLLGIGVFMFYTGVSSRVESAAWMGAAIAMGLWERGWVETAVGIAAAVLIVAPWFQKHNRFLGFLGTISYSLYLVHRHVANKILSLFAGHVQGALLFPLLVVVLAVTILFSWIFYWLIEKPSQNLASRIRYSHPARHMTTFGDPVEVAAGLNRV
jgi:peptidoglycan/LPS O-acetylase OafA/YrhL